MVPSEIPMSHLANSKSGCLFSLASRLLGGGMRVPAGHWSVLVQHSWLVADARARANDTCSHMPAIATPRVRKFTEAVHHQATNPPKRNSCLKHVHLVFCFRGGLTLRWLRVLMVNLAIAGLEYVFDRLTAPVACHTRTTDTSLARRPTGSARDTKCQIRKQARPRFRNNSRSRIPHQSIAAG